MTGQKTCGTLFHSNGRHSAIREHEQPRARPRPTNVTARRLQPQRDISLAVLVTANETNTRIAEIMGVSVKTLEYQLCRLFRKVGVTTRVELAT
jgi:DNA-binding NarL/FixJ family response regulator